MLDCQGWGQWLPPWVFPVTLTSFIYRDFKAPKVSFWVENYHINDTLPFFLVCLYLFFFLLFICFHPKKYWYQNVWMQSYSQGRGLLTCGRSRFSLHVWRVSLLVSFKQCPLLIFFVQCHERILDEMQPRERFHIFLSFVQRVSSSCSSVEAYFSSHSFTGKEEMDRSENNGL